MTEKEKKEYLLNMIKDWKYRLENAFGLPGLSMVNRVVKEMDAALTIDDESLG